MVGLSVELASKEQDKEQVRIQDIIQFCSVPRSRKAMQEFMGLDGRRNFSEKYIKPLLEMGRIKWDFCRFFRQKFKMKEQKGIGKIKGV